jgi:GINS complex subunit 2
MAIQNEKNGNTLESLPFYYIEIANLLLTHAKDDIEACDQVSSLLQDLENIRFDRMKIAINSMADTVKAGSKVYVATVTNISSMEILLIQDLVSESLSQFRILTTLKNEPEKNRVDQSYEVDEVAVGATDRKLRRFRS